MIGIKYIKVTAICSKSSVIFQLLDRSVIQIYRNKMNKICVAILIVALSAVALAAPAGEGPEPKTVREINENDGTGSYHFT